MVRVETTDTSNGGGDTIECGSGDDIAIGGPVDDDISGNSGANVILGDHGKVVLDDGTSDAHTIYTTNPGTGGSDTLKGGDNADILIGGYGADTINGDAGDDVILGDSGKVIRSSTNVVQRILSTDTDAGCADTIHGGEDNDILIGGAGNDTINGNSGSDVILGDSGVVVREDPDAADDNDIFTTSSTVGGADTISGGTGADIILGEFGDDDITGDAGNDIVIGDSGCITRGSGDAVERIETTNPQDGGDDTIYGKDGLDILIGGVGADTINGGDNPDVILGDNGVVVRNDPDAEDDNDIYTTDPGIGGNDILNGREAKDILIGGPGEDKLTGEAGQDILVGDHACIKRDNSDVVERIATDFNYTGDGGDDTIHGNEDADIIIGGVGSDNIYGHEGDDVILGDSGVVVSGDGSAEANDIYTTNPTTGGSDNINSGAGDDIVLAGYEADGIIGWSGDDIIIGDNGKVSRNSSDAAERIEPTNPGDGGADAIYGNSGNDILVLSLIHI